MSRIHYFFISVLAAATVFAADAPKANLHLTMLTKVNPNGLALWDITNAAIGDDGEIDAKLLKENDWSKLLAIGRALEEGGKTLANSNGIIAALPGAKLQDEANEGAATAADVQRYVNAKPSEFRKQALQLQETGLSIAQAASKRDAKQLSAVSSALDGVCEGCHTVFWYPQQKK
ncbi:MAG: hypothetical protein QM808_03650 [Steroidobacteraceae bacterium]